MSTSGGTQPRTSASTDWGDQEELPIKNEVLYADYDDGDAAKSLQDIPPYRGEVIVDGKIQPWCDEDEQWCDEDDENGSGSGSDWDKDNDIYMSTLYPVGPYKTPKERKEEALQRKEEALQRKLQKMAEAAEKLQREEEAERERSLARIEAAAAARPRVAQRSAAAQFYGGTTNRTSKHGTAAGGRYKALAPAVGHDSAVSGEAVWSGSNVDPGRSRRGAGSGSGFGSGSGPGYEHGPRLLTPTSRSTDASTGTGTVANECPSATSEMGLMFGVDGIATEQGSGEDPLSGWAISMEDVERFLAEDQGSAAPVSAPMPMPMQTQVSSQTTPTSSQTQAHTPAASMYSHDPSASGLSVDGSVGGTPAYVDPTVLMRVDDQSQPDGLPMILPPDGSPPMGYGQEPIMPWMHESVGSGTPGNLVVASTGLGHLDAFVGYDGIDNNLVAPAAYFGTTTSPGSAARGTTQPSMSPPNGKRPGPETEGQSARSQVQQTQGA